MSIPGLQYGEFFGNISYVRWGTGNKQMIIFPGGPGNTVPSSFIIRMFNREFDPFIKEYSITLISRKKGQPKGYSTRDMANDYAKILTHDFNGHVDLIIGISMGGMIAQHFAADHPGLSDQIVIAIAAHKMSDTGKKIDYKYAQLLSQGKTRNAAALSVNALYPPGITAFLYKAIFWLLGSAVIGQTHETFKKDVLVEAQAELNHEAKESLTRIHVPILIIGGTTDVYFPREYMEEMASLINGSKLILYKGKGHLGTLEDEAFAKDIFEFIRREGSKTKGNP